MKSKVICFVLLVLFTACQKRQTAKFEKTEDGIIVHLDQKNENDVKLIRLQVVSDKIIHVSAVSTDTLPKAKSLIVVEKERPSVKWEVKESNDEVSLNTSSVHANVSLHTGEVTFTDSEDNIILKENKGGGKTFTPVSVDEEKSFSIRQVFDSPKDEAFYGLGQHQNGEMNYKGLDVKLLQYNTDVAVPFLVSSKNYGILWDNYSVTKFGDIRDYKPLSGLTLDGEDHTPGGITASYISKSDSNKIFISRKESTIDYEFIPALKNAPKEFPMGEGRVIWSGHISTDSAGLHKFYMTHAGYAKVWVEGKLIADKWRQCWNPGSTKFTIDMEKGKKYHIKIDWIPDGGESYISLKWLKVISEEDESKLSLYSEVGDKIDYYFVYGKNMDEVVSGYREVTGKATIMPKWAMGFWQSRERYKTQEEILSVVKEYRKRQIPLDNIVMDWFYWKKDQWGSHQFDPERFPDPQGMIKDLHEKYNTNFMISVWPKFYTGTKNYDLFNEKGWLYKKNVQDNQKDWIGYVSTFYDAYNAEARKSFWDLVNKELYSKGVDAWWLDASEPDILSNSSIRERQLLMNPTALGPSAKYFNAFPLVNASAVYDGQRKDNPDKRVFILTRSAFAGNQRYAAATWSGDISARWHDLKAQIPAGLNFSMSGIPYWTMDIGGFAVEKRYENATGADLEEWREQMTRWFQFGAFCPIFRVHGQFPYREIFNVAPDNHYAYQSMLYYDKLRYRLMPYIYSMAGHAYHNDYTIMRGLVMDFGSDAKVNNIGDQFMFGPNLLINPVYEYKARNRNVYLPASTGWYDLYNGKYYAGGQSIQAEAPVDKIPVFVKEGAIVPVGPEIQYTTEKPADPITLFVYTGKDGHFDLYEDENVNYSYEKGQFTTIPLTYNEQSQTLTIGERKGSFQGMLNERTFQLVWIKKDKPTTLSFDSKYDKLIKYDGKSQSIKME